MFGNLRKGGDVCVQTPLRESVSVNEYAGVCVCMCVSEREREGV